MTDPFQVVRDFEKAVGEYTGAPYVVAVNSCTMALLLALAYQFHDLPDRGKRRFVRIPKRTYVSVPMSIHHAGGEVGFIDKEWTGGYELEPWGVWDYARRFTSGMYVPGQFQCLSFHQSKILGDSQGGAVIHDDPEADAWLRRARFDGRTEGVAPKDDHFDMIGWHCYMSPDIAIRLLWKLSCLPLHNEDLPNDPYPDLSTFEVFK